MKKFLVVAVIAAIASLVVPTMAQDEAGRTGFLRLSVEPTRDDERVHPLERHIEEAVFQGARLGDVLRLVSHQTGVEVILRAGDADLIVDRVFADIPAEQMLAEILEPFGFTYRMEGDARLRIVPHHSAEREDAWHRGDQDDPRTVLMEVAEKEDRWQPGEEREDFDPRVYDSAMTYLMELNEDFLEFVPDEDAGIEERREVLHTLLETARELLVIEEDLPRALETAERVHLLELQLQRLERRYHEAESEEEGVAVRTEMEQVLREGFEATQELRTMEAQAIERELEEVYRALEKRRENRERIIERRLMEMTEGIDPYEW